MKINTPTATLILRKQFPLRSQHHTMGSTERQAWLQNQRDALNREVDSTRSVYCSIRSPIMASRYGSGRTDSRSRQRKVCGEQGLISSPNGLSNRRSCCESFVRIFAAPVYPPLRRETVVLPGPRAAASVRQQMS